MSVYLEDELSTTYTNASHVGIRREFSLNTSLMERILGLFQSPDTRIVQFGSIPYFLRHESREIQFCMPGVEP